MPNAGRSVGSDASKQQMWDAISTSVGVKAQVSTARKASPSFSGSRKPSTQGLQTSKSAWVQPKGSGYSTARKRGPKIPRSLNKPPSYRTHFRPSAGMVDYTRGLKGDSSIARLSKRNKFNRMF